MCKKLQNQDLESRGQFLHYYFCNTLYIFISSDEEEEIIDYRCKFERNTKMADTNFIGELLGIANVRGK